jgi:uncharacterized heparinase superfamily protein
VGALVKDAQVRLPSGAWQKSVARSPSMLEPTTFRFLNQVHTMPAQGGWNDTGLEKLWLYNLHYFDDLNAQDASARFDWHRALISRWIAENPPASGNGWEPYPTSLRIVNWVKWLVAGNVPPPSMVNSLVQQSGWLIERLERHLLGNHLFANAKALVFAGLYLDGPQAVAWMDKGLNIIEEQLPEQVLADGGNFERSPMYHAIFLEDVLDLINAAHYGPRLVPDEQVAVWLEMAGRMLSWLAGMTHPDGEIALFNDAAFGVAPRLEELKAYAWRVGVTPPNLDREIIRVDVSPPMSTEVELENFQKIPELLHFADSGYVRLQNKDAVAFLDLAPIGPDYLPGHAHADTLSFELSLFGQRVIVNGGTSRYGLGQERLRERGTAAHSTVQVAGADSSEVWGGFRVARRAYPFDLDLQPEIGRVACSHDGYQRLPGAPVHRRAWQLEPHRLQLTDTVQGGAHSAVARYILHPAVQVTNAEGGLWYLTLVGGQQLQISVLHGQGSLALASYAPEFGKQLPTQALVVELIEGLAKVEVSWSR